MPIKIQSDAIRVAILNKFGGIWMDADNIVLNGGFIRKLKKYELAVIMDKRTNFPYIAFMSASNNSVILKEWLKQIITNVKKFREMINKYTNLKLNIDSKNELEWHYLGKEILAHFIRSNFITRTNFLGIDNQKINVFPQLQYFKNTTLSFKEKYLIFFFQSRNPKTVLDISKDLVFLINSWTPLKYKMMSEKEFLYQNILLSKLLFHLLK